MRASAGSGWPEQVPAVALWVPNTTSAQVRGRLGASISKRFGDFAVRLDYDAAPGPDPELINELATCRYLDTATNILLIGPPGVGKTHVAVGLARKAAEAGYRTYFTTAADLAARCHRAAIEGRWATTLRFFNGPTLLVIDELGYPPARRSRLRPVPGRLPAPTSRPAS